MTPSNYKIKVVGCEKKQFELAMQLAFEMFDKTTHWTVDDNKLLLYWHQDESKQATKLPYPMNVKQATEFAWGWLQNVEPSDPYPDIDGSVEDDGFELETTETFRYYFVSIKKVWVFYHK